MSQLLYNVFIGHYSFERSISSPQVTFSGTAIFKKSTDNKILYREEGQYSLRDAEQVYYQERIFVLDNTQFNIYKNDESILHNFTIDNVRFFPIKLKHIHHCNKDQYTLTLDIHSEDSFVSLYLIKGPSKDFTINTKYTRQKIDE